MYTGCFLGLRGLAGVLGDLTALATFGIGIASQCASMTPPSCPGVHGQQQPQSPQPPHGLHPERGFIHRIAPAIKNPRIPASLCVNKVKPEPTIKNIAPMIRLQFLEPGLQEFFILSSTIHHTIIIDYLISDCQYLYSLSGITNSIID